MELKCFESREELVEATVGLLERHFSAGSSPHAVMLSGGSTPLPAYARLAKNPVSASDDLHVFLSDERMVPMNDPQSNYGPCKPMFYALGLREDRALRVRTELPIAEAAQDYHDQLSVFLDAGGKISLGLLGLGADGHTASLFSKEDASRAGEGLAIPVERSDGPSRVSVTAKLIGKADTIVFLVAGAEKRGVVDTLLKEPDTIPAGIAAAGVAHVEVWVDRDACPSC
jgi:6-phosphogluconolactonase